MLQTPVFQLPIIPLLPPQSLLPERREILRREHLAIARAREDLRHQLRPHAVVIALGLVAPAQTDIVLDRAMTIQLVQMQTLPATGVALALVAQAEAAEEVRERVAGKGPEAGRGGGGGVFEEGGVGEEGADGGADAEVGHGGAEVVGVDGAAVAWEVAVVGEGVDDGAGGAEVGGEGRGVGAAGEGWGGHGGGRKGSAEGRWRGWGVRCLGCLGRKGSVGDGV